MVPASVVRLAVLAVGIGVKLECKSSAIIIFPIVASKARKVDIADGCLASISFAGVVGLFANVDLSRDWNTISGGGAGSSRRGRWLSRTRVDCSRDRWLRRSCGVSNGGVVLFASRNTAVLARARFRAVFRNVFAPVHEFETLEILRESGFQEAGYSLNCTGGNCLCT